METRVRFAPSPTGVSNVGHVRVGIFNYFFAKHYHGALILRIDDTDRKRCSLEAENRLIDNLKWLGLQWQEGPDLGGNFGPYRQSERLDLYQFYLQKLINSGRAYSLNGKSNDIDQSAIYLKVQTENDISYDDQILGKRIFRKENVKDFIIARSDGAPTYHLACVIDDALMQISHVIRSAEHIVNTPKQILLIEALGFQRPIYAHLPMMLGKNGKKLSKQDAQIYDLPIYIETCRERGYLPEALINFLSLMNWSPKTNEILLPPERIAAETDFERIHKSPARFDVDKLNWINNQFIRSVNTKELLPLAREHLAKCQLHWKNDKYLLAVLNLVRPSIQYFSEFPIMAGFFFSDNILFESESAKVVAYSDNAQKIYSALLIIFGQTETITRDSFSEAMQRVKQGLNLSSKEIWIPVRIALTGKFHGPELAMVAELLGKQICLERLSYLQKETFCKQ
jgi:glutamyl-tRNA synthetase